MAENEGPDTTHSELQTPPESSPVFPVPLKEARRISDLKVEVPLTGCIGQDKGGRQDASLKDVLNSVTSLCGGTRATIADLAMASDQAPYLTGEISSPLKDAAERARRQVEQERLSDPGSGRRVPIPIMDFTIPELKWKRLSTPAASLFRSVGFSTPDTISRQIKNSAKEERKLRWRPLNGSSGKISLSERIAADSEGLKLLLGIPGDAEAYDMKLEGLLARDTLRFLGEYEDGNEEIPLRSPLLKQRRSPFPSPGLSPSVLKRTQQSPNREGAFSKKPRHECERVTGGDLGFLNQGNVDGVGGLLTSYLKIRAPEKAFPTKSAHFSTPARADSTGTPLGFQNLVQPPRGNQISGPQAPSLQMECPESDPRRTGSRYIVSASLGKPVIRQLDHLCPMAKLFTRDFSSHAKPTGPSSTRGKGSPLAHEADIPLSSSTGAVIVGMVQLQQPSLAGDGGAQLRQKILKVAAMYDKVIVLISMSKASWTSDDTRAYVDFVAFSKMLDTSIETVLIGDKGECLTKWIICLMNEYRHEGRKNEHLLVEGETTWETFFRLGGVNVYAAQVLSGALSTTYGSQGLARLLAMAPDERIAAFAPIIGTRRPLDNLSRWVSKGRI